MIEMKYEFKYKALSFDVRSDKNDHPFFHERFSRNRSQTINISRMKNNGNLADTLLESAGQKDTIKKD